MKLLCYDLLGYNLRDIYVYVQLLVTTPVLCETFKKNLQLTTNVSIYNIQLYFKTI